MLGLIALTLPLSLDTFLVAAAIGITRPSHRHRLRIGALFAFFEGGMPLLGLLIGTVLSRTLGAAAEYVAIVILIGFGTYTFFQARQEDDAAQKLPAARGFALLALGISISLDGLAVGFTYGLLKVPIIPVTVLIVAQAFIASQIGFAIGGNMPERLRDKGEQLVGVVLIVIGLGLLLAKVV